MYTVEYYAPLLPISAGYGAHNCSPTTNHKIEGNTVCIYSTTQELKHSSFPHIYIFVYSTTQGLIKQIQFFFLPKAKLTLYLKAGKWGGGWR